MISPSSKHPMSKHSKEPTSIRWMREFDRYPGSLLGSKIIIIPSPKTINKFKANFYRVLHPLQVRRRTMILLRKFPSFSKLSPSLTNKSARKSQRRWRKRNNSHPRKLPKTMRNQSLPRGSLATARRQNVLSSIVIVLGKILPVDSIVIV